MTLRLNDTLIGICTDGSKVGLKVDRSGRTAEEYATCHMMFNNNIQRQDVQVPATDHSREKGER